MTEASHNHSRAVESDEVVSSEASKSSASRLGRVAKKVGAIASISVVSFLGGSVAMNSSAGHTERKVGPVTVDVGLEVNFDKVSLGLSKSTKLELPYPVLGLSKDGTTIYGGVLGDIKANTHDYGPKIAVTPKALDLEEFTSPAIERPAAIRGMSVSGIKDGTADVLDNTNKDLDAIYDDKWLILGRALGSFAMGAFVSGYAVSSIARRKRLPSKNQILSAGLATTVLVGSCVGLKDYNADAFQSPEYEGLAASVLPYVESVPSLDQLDNTEAYKTMGGFYAFSRIVQSESAQNANLPPTSMKLLLVPDIHNRNVYPMLKQVIDRYGIDAVIDSGDLTDWGTVDEAMIAVDPSSAKLRDATIGIKDLGVDYYFASGNHDSKEVTDILSTLGNVSSVAPNQIKTFDIGGLRVVIAGDPFHNTNIHSVKNPDALVYNFRTDLNENLTNMESEGAPADIVVTHEPYMLTGVASPLMANITGHIHTARSQYDKNDNVWNINIGTTGGSGLRMAQPEEEATTLLPEPENQSFMILEISADCQLVKIHTFENNLFTSDASVSTTVNTHLNKNVEDSDKENSQRCKG